MVKSTKVQGGFQVRVTSGDAEAFVRDASVTAAFKSSIAEKAGVEEAEVVVTLSVVSGGGSADRARGGGRKMSMSQIRFRSADQAEIQVDYVITVEEEVDGSSVQLAMTSVSAEEFASSFSAQLGGSGSATGGASGYTVEAVAASATAPTVDVQVSATGDPHLVNVHGQRFDLMRPGNHTMISIPRGSSPDRTLIDVVALAEHIGYACTDMYVQTLTITGAWAAGVPGAQRHENNSWGVRYFAQQPPRRGSRRAGWNAYGKIRLKATWGRTSGGGVKYMNLLARNLIHAGCTVGGLLGEDDHTTAATPVEGCMHVMSLIETS